MIKNMLKRRKESDTYLATNSRHHRSPQIAMKVDKVCNFQPALQPSLAEEGDDFHCNLWTPAMSNVSSQVGVALFPSFSQIFYHFTIPRFPFILIKNVIRYYFLYRSVTSNLGNLLT